MPDLTLAAMLLKGVTLYFIRHGETDWNVCQRYQGQTDVPLNNAGREQAVRNGRALERLLGARVDDLDFVASPLSRATETMEIVRRQLHLAPNGFRIDDRLREINFGHWEGLLWNELPRIDPDGFAARKADPWRWQPKGGESYAALSGRVAGWLAEIAHDALVVSHGGVSRVLRGLLLGLAPRDIPRLEVPQDKVMMLSSHCLRWI
jgi:probable phosphoglycerate mutase